MNKAVLIALVALAPTAAFAETLRCGNALVSEGATQGYVAEKCGEPDSKQTFTEPVFARRLDGTSYENGTVSRDVWRYKRGARSFPAVLTFAAGVLRKIEFEK